MATRQATATAAMASLTPKDIADGAEARAVTFGRDASDAGVCVADGMGLRIVVERGALVVEDGMGEHRRSRRYDKATHGLSRLVVLSTYGGFASFDALRWLDRLGIGSYVLDGKGTALLCSAPRRTDDARLRRTQAHAPDLPVGLDIARFLIGRKVAGQAGVLRSRLGDEGAAATVEEIGAGAEVAESVDEVRQLEAAAAETYWQSWVGRPEAVPRFASRDRSRVPKHWLTYHGRRSVLRSANGNRKAERPANALVNYLYAGCLEAEAILACQAVGLDPGFGIVHLDARSRQSLALDLMEPVRPEIDAYVLDLLAHRTFRKVEFTETTDGHVRLKAPITHELAETVPRWARSLAPYAEYVAHVIGQTMAGKYQPVTPLTGRRGRAAQATVKARKAAASARSHGIGPRQRPTTKAELMSWSCPDCGGPVTDRHRVRCDACIAKDPRQSTRLRATRAAAISRRRQAEAEWQGTGMDPEHLQTAVLSALASVKLAAIVEACGVSKSTASSWRTGKVRPHPMHWQRLSELVR